MKSFLTSFYAKISAIFLALLLLLGSALVYITYHSSMQLMREADQKLNLKLADNMARELQPLVTDSLRTSAVKESIHYMMVMNPKVEIYLLDRSGEILAFFAEPGKEVKSDSISVASLRRFLTQEEQTLIQGPDPRHPGGRKPFSAAQMSIMGKPGYLYIILGGEQFDSALGMVRNSYIVRSSLFSLLLAVLATGIIGLIVFAILTRRLRRMSETVQAFETGKRDRRITITTDDELGDLAHSFNSMADTIVSQMQQLKENDRMRRELVANISHDLRSPLASIQGYLETILIKDDSLSPQKRREYIETILKNTTQLSELVQDLFELSKLEARQAELNFESFPLDELAHDIIIKLKPDAEKHRIHLQAETEQSDSTVYADIGLIERTITNLIQNAFQFTEEGGRVTLRTRSHGDEIRVEIQDNGSGIDEHDLPHIFERFYVGSKNKSRTTEGTGLGLAIAQKIVELHDSDIHVESEPGRGSHFYFDLPIPNSRNGTK